MMIWNLYKESWLLLCFLLPLPPLLEFLLLPAIVIVHDHCGGRWWGSSEEEHKGWSHLWSQVILSSSPLSATPLLPLLPLWFSELLPLCVEKLFSNTELVELRASSITDLRGGSVSKKCGESELLYVWTLIWWFWKCRVDSNRFCVFSETYLQPSHCSGAGSCSRSCSPDQTNRLYLGSFSFFLFFFLLYIFAFIEWKTTLPDFREPRWKIEETRSLSTSLAEAITEESPRRSGKF